MQDASDPLADSRFCNAGNAVQFAYGNDQLTQPLAPSSRRRMLSRWLTDLCGIRIAFVGRLQPGQPDTLLLQKQSKCVQSC